MEKVLARFLHYIGIDTQSSENSPSVPSSQGQLLLGKELARELKSLGLKDVRQDKNGYVMATLPGNIPHQTPVIGFIAHLDTSPDYPGKNIKPQLVRNYQGGPLVLNRQQGIRMEEKDYPELSNYYGQDLVTTDGTTLLGADDKAGIAEIITALDYLLRHPEIKHGPIRVAFTPDEEIGKGTDHFNLNLFAADFAYTVDGGELGLLETENFNAASATFTIRGVNVHPGTAKNKMINSQLFLNDIIAFFPGKEIPAATENYEGFYHLLDIAGSVEKTVVRYLIRDHDRQKFEERKALAQSCRDTVNARYGMNLVSLEIKDAYYNMKEILDKHPHIIELAQRAMQQAGVPPRLNPIRGGTDGARLSFRGLPTPNLFTGGHNFHGRYEFIPVPSMIKAVATIVNICRLGAELEWPR